MTRKSTHHVQNSVYWEKTYSQEQKQVMAPLLAIAFETVHQDLGQMSGFWRGKLAFELLCLEAT